jgi:ATP-grasp domain
VGDAVLSAEAPTGFDAISDRSPRILLATTGRLPSSARLAMELHDSGAQVSLLAPRNHPGKVLDCLAHRMIYRALAPERSLEVALLRLRPDLVIPCDERAVRDLHQLCRRTRHAGLRLLIERSLGPVDSFPVTTSRADFLAVARRHGVRVPPFMALPSVEALDLWIAQHPAPFVLKADGSWSGFGVRIISDVTESKAAYASMIRRASGRLALREMLLEGNNFALRSWMQAERPAMSVQGYVDGWPANIGVACWQGEVLAATCVECVATVSATGPSTIARIIDNPEMMDAARRVVKALSLTGMIGLDFMIEAATGFAYLIEMNPRNTPICAVRLGPGHNLAEALVARLAGRPERQKPSRTEREILAFFPDTWMQDPSNQFLYNGYHDVPWEQPELVRVLMRPELRDRYWITRLLRKAWWKLQGQQPPG